MDFRLFEARRYRDVPGWSGADLPGLSPLVLSLLLHERCQPPDKPARQHTLCSGWNSHIEKLSEDGNTVFHRIEKL